MTEKARFLDDRGRRLYGAKEIPLSADSLAYVLIDEEAFNSGVRPAWKMTGFPTKLPLESGLVDGVVRSFATVIDDDTVHVTRTYTQGERELKGTTVYQGSKINSAREIVLLPGLNEGDKIRAELVWERDYPVVNSIKKWANRKRTISRLKNVLSR